MKNAQREALYARLLAGDVRNSNEALLALVLKGRKAGVSKAKYRANAPR